MPKKMEWTVRVILPQEQHGIGLEWAKPGAAVLIESLRYAGLLQVIRDNDHVLIFDIRAPHGLDTQQWAKMNAERMRSFGYDAAPAPRWQGTTAEDEELALRQQKGRE